MARAKVQTNSRQPTSLEFFSHLRWIDGKPLLDTIEPYRRKLFSAALDQIGSDGLPVFNLVLAGRAKKNWKSADLVLAGLYKLLIPSAVQGNDAFVLANDEGQAGDDLALAKKLVAVNPDLAAELEPLQKEIRRRDGRGSLKILPARDAIGAHGKTAIFIGFDEVHGYKNYDLIEALAPDPTRTSALIWITTYDTIFNTPGVPLFDLKQIGFAGSDPRMLFSWYSGDRCTDPDFAELEPELRANPSIASWPEGRAYLQQQRRRLPTHKYRRLHLNMPGAPNGAFLDQGAIISATVSGRKILLPEEGQRYVGFVDMSGGSSDDAVLAIAHVQGKRAILDMIAKQAGVPPFDPRAAVAKFVGLLRQYGISAVTGDAYAGMTFVMDFEAHGIRYRKSAKTTSELYEAFEPRLNAGEVELLDIPELNEQLMTLVVRGRSVTHQPGDHDDWSNAACGALNLAAENRRGPRIEAIGVPMGPPPTWHIAPAWLA
jgi:hypothetical protein